MDDFFDLANISEDQFDQMAVYFVPDQPAENSSTLSRAEQTLPRNLAIKPSQTKTSVSTLFIYILNISSISSISFNI